MSQLGTVYATKRRRRNGKSLKPPPKDGVAKSNPSKRHRERLNAELDTLASLLPFEQNVLSKLDRLSILRLSVSYLRTKSYFQVVMHKDKEDGMPLAHPNVQNALPLSHAHEGFRNRDLTTYDHTPLDGDMFLQALNGFLMILTCEGEVFFATHSIESYLGFHQSDIVHQSVYELVHSEDREELQRQLLWNSFLGPPGGPQHSPNGGHAPGAPDHGGSGGIALAEALQPHNCHLLERSFTVRFRCLLDNTSGFLRLDIRGRVKILHGQNRRTEEPPLALFAICTPFGPPSLLEVPQKEVMFKSKHKLDLALVSMDQRGKMLLGYSDGELANMGGYDLVHFDDLAYVASAHQELLKTGASGMIAYRFQTKDGQWQWLQTSSRLVYKNSKPDFVISTHRPLMEEEGRDLLGKRTMDFKVSYLDAGLTNSYFTDSDQLSAVLPASTSPASMQPAPQRVNRRYKTQLRDFLSTCRTKRKLSHAAQPQNTPTNPPIANTIPVDYISPENHLSPLAAYTNLNNIYPSAYPTATIPAQDNSLPYMGHSNFQTIYPDNRFLTTDNLFHQYRPLGTYYPEYHTTATAGYVTNGFLDMSPRGSTLPTYDPTTSPYQIAKDDKIYTCQQVIESPKYSYGDVSRGYTYPISPMTHSDSNNKLKHSPMELSSPENPSPNGILTPKMDDVKAEILTASSGDNHAVNIYQEPRQTVLMWGSAINNHNNSNSRSPHSNSSTPSLNNGSSYHDTNKLKNINDMNQQNHHVKNVNDISNEMQQIKHVGDMNPQELNQIRHLGDMGSGINADLQGAGACKWSNGHAAGLYSHHGHHGHHGHQEALGHGAEVWQHAQYHHAHQYYPYTSQYAQSSSLDNPSLSHTSPPCLPSPPHGSHGHAHQVRQPISHRTGVLCCPSRR